MSRKDTAVAGPSGIQNRKRKAGRAQQDIPRYPWAETRGGSRRDEGDETLLQPPVMASPSSAASSPRPKTSSVQGASKKRRRALNLSDVDTLNILNDSGSDGDDEEPLDLEEDIDGDEGGVEDFLAMRRRAREMRDRIVQGDEDRVLYDHGSEIVVVGESVCDRMLEVLLECGNISLEEYNERVISENEMDVRNENEKGREECTFISAERVNTTYCWSEDFTSFTGQKESYLRVPGPTFAARDPVDIFLKIWDHEFMEMVVKETNQYAWEIISMSSDPDIGPGIPTYLDPWTEITVNELYRYFAVLILLSLCQRYKICDYWHTGIMGMQDFRKVMARNRFVLISKFLHFIPNDDLLTTGNNRKIAKVAPVVDHCNRKFAELYTPSQHLSLDESMVLWRGRSLRQGIRSKAGRSGIKSFELCEAETGYLLQFRLHTGQSADLHPEPLHGFRDYPAKRVLDLMEGYLDVGHVLVMDNWYNQLALTRYLKTRRTDVLGTLNRRGRGIPPSIKDLTSHQMERGSVVPRHCGDIALFAWKNRELVTAISSYHQHEMVPETRAGQAIWKPIALQEYNRYMGGVDLKDQKLSKFPMERKSRKKWYIKVFRRLYNSSLLNAFIIYKKHPKSLKYSHSEFRQKIAEGLLSRFPRESPAPVRAPRTVQMSALRLQDGHHFPIHTKRKEEGKAKCSQMRCVRCLALKRRVMVTVMCKLCQVPLCLGQCWEDYHTLKDLGP